MVLFLLVLAAPVTATPLLLADSREYKLAGHLEMLSDPAGTLTLAEVAGSASGRFRPLPGFLGIGYGDQTIWLRFTFARTAAYHDECYLRLGPAYLDNLTVYVQEGAEPGDPSSYREYRLGDHQPATNRPVRHPLFVVPVQMPTLDEHTVYLRLRTTSAIELSGSILPPVEMVSFIDSNILYNGVYLGVTLAIVLVNLLYFLRFRDPVIGYYVLYITALFANYLGVEGLIVLLWPGHPPLLSDYLVACGSGSAYIFFSLFGMHLFNTGREHSWAHRYFQYVIAVGVLMIMSVVFGWYSRVAGFVMLNGLALVLVMTGLSVRLVRRGELGGKIYLLAFSLSNLGFAVTFLRLLTVLPVNALTSHAYQTGTVLNMILISLALTERLHAAEKQAAAVAMGAEARAVQLAEEMTGELRQKQQELTVALQTEQELLRRRTRFLEMITHEYRTPLAIIRTNLDIMEDRGGEAVTTLRPYLDKMRRGVVRLIEVMEVALARVRVDELSAGAKFYPLPLVPLLMKVVEEARRLRPERLIEAKIADGPWEISGDAVMLKTAINNLVDNACKYSPPETTIQVSLVCDNEVVAVLVRDQGQGIPESELDKVFDKYYRGTGSSGSGGAGIGLYMVRRIIEQHHGFIVLSGGETVGTVVKVVLPLLKTKEISNG